MKMCPDCQCEFPDHLVVELVRGDAKGLVRELKCPLCALEQRNTFCGLPEGTPFEGSKAKALWGEAVRYLQRTEQARRK